MRNWDFRDFRARVNLRSPRRQVQVLIWGRITPIRGLPNPIRHVIPLISHIHSYPPHDSHLHPISLSSSSKTQPSSQNTKLSHPSLSFHAMIMSSHWVQHTPSTAYTEYSIYRVQHTPSTAYTEYSIHWVQDPSKIDCLLCWQRVRVTRQRSGFRPEKWFGSVPEPSKNSNRSFLAIQTRPCTLQPAGFAGFG